MIRPRYLLLLSFALAACGPDRPADSTGDTVRASADSAARVTRAVDTLPSAATAPRSIALAADGLEVSAGGAPQRLAFGAARASALAEVGGVLGQPVQQGMQEECPAGPLYQVSYAGGLQLVFQDSAFVGWFAQPGSTLRTTRKIGPGSTLAQLKAAYPATKVEETSLGHEFDAGELWGIVTDTTDAGVVEVLFAGINCIFR
ncbi:MAG TPA: hypothetical protein VGX50_07795 [Longimicrobium sp.]|nr:hypothetical protein [Longimicrobium sp.]